MSGCVCVFLFKNFEPFNVRSRVLKLCRIRCIDYLAHFGKRFGDLDALSSVCIFSWLEYPYIRLVSRFEGLKGMQEFLELWICVARLFHIESQWQCSFKGINSLRIVIVANVSTKGCLVRKMVIIVQFAVDEHRQV